MAQCNVTQAEVLASATSEEERMTLAGQSVVAIRRTPGRESWEAINPRKVISQSWVLDVATAMEVFLDCKSYSTALADDSTVEHTLYGIAKNTGPAAVAFERVHNLVQRWALKQRGQKNSYCLGVADGLSSIARQEKRREAKETKDREAKELRARIKKEAEQRANELERLERSSGFDRDERPHADQSHRATVSDDVNVGIEDDVKLRIFTTSDVSTARCIGSTKSTELFSPQVRISDHIVESSDEEYHSALEDFHSDHDDEDNDEDDDEQVEEGDLDSPHSSAKVTFKQENELKLDLSDNLDNQIELQKRSMLQQHNRSLETSSEPPREREQETPHDVADLTVQWSSSQALTLPTTCHGDCRFLVTKAAYQARSRP